MTKDDFLLIDGFKDKLATKIHNNIKKALSEINLAELMSASNLLGRGMGTIRIQNILDVYPNILNSKLSEKELIHNIEKNVNGFSTKNASLFVENIHKFKKFIKESNIDIKKFQNEKENDIINQTNSTNHPLNGKKIVFTGVRNKDLEKKLKSIGCVIVNNVSKDTFLVVMKNDISGPPTNKLIEAEELNINIIGLDDFNNKYKLL